MTDYIHTPDLSGAVSFGMLSFHADFNSLMEDGSIAVSRRFAKSHRTPCQGEWIELHDHEGNSYNAVVVEATDGAVEATVDFSTWSPALHLERQDAFEPETGFRAELSPDEKLEPALA